MTWFYNGKEMNSLEDFEEGVIGFIYIITNMETGRRYIGKKILTGTRKVQRVVKLKTTGEKKKKNVRKTVESDWLTYYGSSPELAADVEKMGTECFNREIIHMCRSKAEMSYLETREIFVRDCLLKPDYYYNGWVTCRVTRAHLKNLQN